MNKKLMLSTLFAIVFSSCAYCDEQPKPAPESPTFTTDRNGSPPPKKRKKPPLDFPQGNKLIIKSGLPFDANIHVSVQSRMKIQ
jgi:hypothetical protein